MNDYMIRVVSEASLLELKIGKLKAFFDTNRYTVLKIDEKYRLKTQLKFMELYLGVLQDRIEA